MSLTTTIKAMKAAGLSSDQILAVIEQLEAEKEEKRRIDTRERVRRLRNKEASGNASNALQPLHSVTTVTTVTDPLQGSNGFPHPSLTPNIPPKENPLKGVKEKSPNLETVCLEDLGEGWLQKQNFSPHFDLAEELDKFRDHYRANGGRQSNGNLIKDWPSTLRNWLRRNANTHAITGKTQVQHYRGGSHQRGGGDTQAPAAAAATPKSKWTTAAEELIAKDRARAAANAPSGGH